MSLLVSDFDDTIKISHTTNRFKVVVRGLFAKQAYAGMAELYQEWCKGRNFILMSSSPKSLKGKIHRFLDRHHFPPREVWLRDWFKQKDIREYKRESLRQFSDPSHSNMIFVGDDSEFDPEVFVEFRNNHAHRVEEIYIRRMRGRPLPDGVIPFHSAFEIALNELRSQRLTLPQVARVGKAILEERDMDRIIPYFAAAPSEIKVQEKYPTLDRITEELNSYYDRIRKARGLT